MRNFRKTIGIDLGAEKHLITQVCKKIKMGKDIATITRELDEDDAKVKSICDVAEKYAPEYDVESIFNEIYNPSQYYDD